MLAGKRATRNRQNDHYRAWSKRGSQSEARCQRPLIQMDTSQHKDVKFNLAGSRAVLQTEFLVNAGTGTATGERQQRSETASELDIVLKHPNEAMIRMTVMGKHKSTQPPLSADMQ